MILYLSSQSHENLIERLEVGFVKNMVGEFDIERFFREDMVRLENIQTIIIDIHAINNSEESFFKALESFLTFSKAKIILYAEEMPQGVIEKLLELEVYNIVISKVFTDFSVKMIKAIEIGYTKEEAYKEHLKIVEKEDNIQKNSYTFLGSGIEIAVYGIVNGSGTTALCLNLATYLANKKAKVIVCGINGNELEEIAVYYDLNVKDNKIVIQENFIIYSEEYALTDEIIKSNNFVIADMGVVKESIYKAKRTIITSYSKEKDIRKIEAILSKKKDIDCFLLRSTEGSKKDKIQKRLKECKIYFSENMPGYFGEENHEIFYELCSDFMIEK